MLKLQERIASPDQESDIRCRIRMKSASILIKYFHARLDAIVERRNVVAAPPPKPDPRLETQTLPEDPAWDPKIDRVDIHRVQTIYFSRMMLWTNTLQLAHPPTQKVKHRIPSAHTRAHKPAAATATASSEGKESASAADSPSAAVPGCTLSSLRVIRAPPSDASTKASAPDGD